MSRDQIQTLKEELASQVLELGLIEADKFEKGSKHASNTGASTFDLLVKDGDVTVESLLKSLSDKYNIPFELNPQPLLPEIKKFPVAFCLKNGVIPITEEPNTIEFGLCHPGSLNALKNLSLMIGKKTKAKFIPPEFIFQSISQKHIHTVGEMEKSELVKKEEAAKQPQKTIIKQSNKAVKLDMDSIKSNKKEPEPELDLAALGKKTKEDDIPQAILQTPTKEEPKKPEIDLDALKESSKKIEERTPPKLDLTKDTKSTKDTKDSKDTKSKKEEAVTEIAGDVVNVVDDILSEAVQTGISDIHIEIFKEAAQIRFRGNGSMLAQTQYRSFITKNYNAVIARIKILANLDIAERRLPQDGKISYQAKDGTEVDFRISILPTSLGERVVIRILNSSSLAVTISALGFTKKQEDEFIKTVEAPQGMVLVTGPTGSGKSTTLYGAMNYLNKPDVNILTAEDPVEYTMSGISQVQVREDIGLTFASALRSFLRQDPEIILVGEIRDAETADIASKAALTGHLVLSTLHTNSAVGAISRLVNMGLPPYLVSSALSLVVAQRLIRKNCEKCKEPVDKKNEDVKKFMGEYNIDENAKLSKGAGCSHCNGTGYSGRMGVHEVLVVNEEIAEAISTGKTEQDILEIATNSGFIPISESGKRFLNDGTLSMEEFLRVIPKED
ncbi:type II/IV secretion system protein [Nitrosomonadales bacterium]|nr:type II/IV secretion system protein [Nitrosomonadales bacterium]